MAPAETHILVCFAVEQEARPFRRRLPYGAGVRVILTGIGFQNANDAIARQISSSPISAVISAGFAGALNPRLPLDAVLFDAEPDFELLPFVLAAGAQPATFHSCNQVVVTAQAKNMLRHLTGRDAVEMESHAIRAACAARGIPSATIRVVSDTAEENLPLDFNALLGKDLRIDYRKLMMALAKSPGSIWRVWVFSRQIQRAAERLGTVLAKIIALAHASR